MTYDANSITFEKQFTRTQRLHFHSQRNAIIATSIKARKKKKMPNNLVGYVVNPKEQSNKSTLIYDILILSAVIVYPVLSCL